MGREGSFLRRQTVSPGQKRDVNVGQEKKGAEEWTLKVERRAFAKRKGHRILDASDGHGAVGEAASPEDADGQSTWARGALTGSWASKVTAVAFWKLEGRKVKSEMGENAWAYYNCCNRPAEPSRTLDHAGQRRGADGGGGGSFT